MGGNDTEEDFDDGGYSTCVLTKRGILVQGVPVNHAYNTAVFVNSREIYTFCCPGFFALPVAFGRPR